MFAWIRQKPKTRPRYFSSGLDVLSGFTEALGLGDTPVSRMTIDLQPKGAARVNIEILVFPEQGRKLARELSRYKLVRLADDAE